MNATNLLHPPATTLPPGTRILFIKNLKEPPCEDHPGIIFAMAGARGTVVHSDKPCPEGHWVIWDGCPNQPFGAKLGEDFTPINPTSGHWRLYQESDKGRIESTLALTDTDEAMTLCRLLNKAETTVTHWSRSWKHN